ncbi:Lactate racemase [bioreactor metagenome]|uniref:Lactate racemase n=1 Tax=bioreactor metagenome TaxID=1076179 RepID=A0A644TMR9_9ZZZZ|nr:nickel-dependent lactate racemase [Negativicutes bacterium]
MADKIFEFAYGKQTIKVALPEKQVINEIEGRPAVEIQDVPAAVLEALHNPIASPPLRDVVQSGDKVAIIVSDITRAWTKFDHFLPTLLDELNAAGIPDSDLFIVISLGAHRPHTDEENVIVCGQEVCHRVAIFQHDAFDQDNLVDIGTTTRGVHALINRRIAEADKVILTGGIAYHMMAGFGGGRKAIMPGVSSFKSIQGNHLFCMHEEVGKGLNENCQSGRLVGNEMNEDMTEIAAFSKPDFLLNAVFTPEGKFAKFVAGHWYKAWEVGCREVEKIYGILIKEQTDLVMASAGGFPKDINLYQGSKTMDNSFIALKPGGVAILFMECPDIYEPPDFSDWFKYRDHLEFEVALRKEFTIPGYIALKLAIMATKITLIVVTEPENLEFIRKTGMMAVASYQEALAVAREKLGRDDYTITVMTHGGSTVPILEG